MQPVRNLRIERAHPGESWATEVLDARSVEMPASLSAEVFVVDTVWK